MLTLKQRQGRGLVNAWNRLHPIGCRCIYINDMGKEFEVTTRGKAWALDDGTALVGLSGPGVGDRGYLLSRCVPVLFEVAG